MKTVPLCGKVAAGRVAFVDDGDYDLVMPYRWYVIERTRNGRMHGPYAATSVWDAVRKHKSVVLMHKLITGYPQTDHKDHDGLNNQRYNLRPATNPQNHANERKTLTVGGKPTSSRFKGVCWSKKNRKWQVRIRVGNGKRLNLGMFASEVDAARAYDDAAREHHGEYAYLNFPQAA